MPRLPLTLAVLTLLALTCAGCIDPCDDSCNDQEARQVQGALSDFTKGPASDQTLTITPAALCDGLAAGSQPTHWFQITGHGATSLVIGTPEDPEAPTQEAGPWITDLFFTLRDDLNLPVHGSGYGLSCGPNGATPFLSTDDWRAADAIAVAVGQALQRDDLAGTVEVRVTQELILCPQIACAY